MIAAVRFASSKAQAAADLGMSVTTLEKWLRRGAPRLSNGYDVDAVAAFIEAWKLRSEESEPEASTSGEDLKKRRLLAECIKLELANAQTRGDLGKVADFQNEAAEMLSAFKSIIDGVPDAIAKDMPDEHRLSAQKTARHHLDLALRKMAAWKAKLDVPRTMPPGT